MTRGENMAATDPFEERRKLLRAQTEIEKRRLGSVFQEAERKGGTALSRLQATTGAPSGALAKAAATQAKDLARARGEAESGIEAQASQQEQAILGEKGQQEFAARESALARQQQESQFGRQLEFQQGSFAEQMRFAFAELDENKKTNMINAAIAIRDSGLRSPKSWEMLAETMGALFGDRFPKAAFVDQNTLRERITRDLNPLTRS